MGNRATVIFTSGGYISPATYLHWNGGPESVYAFLAEMDRRSIPAIGDIEPARFAQIVGEFFTSDGLSLYQSNGPTEITPEALAKVESDHGDNGFYIVDRAQDTVRRFTLNRAGVLEEWPQEVVDREHAAALEQPTFAGVLEFFAPELVATCEGFTDQTVPDKLTQR